MHTISIRQNLTHLRSPPPVCSLSLFLFFVLNIKLGVTLDDLKVKLAWADVASRKSGTLHVHEMTPSQFVLQALKIEEQQKVGVVGLGVILIYL